MIKETATVVSIDGDTVTVEASIKSTCNSCQVQSDCGTGVVSRAFAPKSQQLSLRTPMTVQVGQKVTVGIPEASILSASAWLYLLPLFAFMASFSIAMPLLKNMGMSHELWAILPSIVMTYLAYRFTAFKLKRIESKKYQPVLLETLHVK